MRVSEWIVCGFFAYLVVASRVVPIAGARRARIALVGLVCVGVVITLSQLRLQWPMRVARDWVPGLFLLQGYWLGGLFFTRPMRGVEARLLRFDEWLFRTTRLPAIVRRTPRGVLELFELAYLSAYPFVPGTFGLIYAAGLTAEADRFWTAVLTASFVCYGALPWLQTRPPRAIEPTNPLGDRAVTLRDINLKVLARGSIQVNTLPSGHAATALAAALVTGELLPDQLPLLLAVALAIAVGTLLGRYHYTVDTLLGLAVGCGAWLLSRLV